MPENISLPLWNIYSTTNTTGVPDGVSSIENAAENMEK